MRDLFLLRPDIAFLNHGSFGACPRPVFEQYQQWQLELEREPVEFLGRRSVALMRRAREALAELVGTDSLNLVYVTNATVGVNIVARSLRFEPGDEVLGTDHEYGACERIWRFLGKENGIVYRRATVDVPVVNQQEVVESLFRAVTPRTRVIFVSHITSPTALTFPVAEICRRARQLGIITVIDGAHVPGQIALDLEAIGADFYVGNLHKWLCAPKGVAFLYARPQMQNILQPLVVSWGWESDEPGESLFIDHIQYGGTSDISAALTVPSAIDFQREHNWTTVRASCHNLLLRARHVIARELDAMPLAPDEGGWFEQMSSLLLPDGIDGAQLQKRLFDEHGVEIPVFNWNGRQTIRISVQAYNTWQDVERLISGIQAIVRPAE